MRGVLVAHKPSGISSYDVIRRLKKLVPAHTPLGHAGTLDPLASGVLVVLIGDATKVSSLLMNHDKEYEAGILLGRSTDTDDVTGRTLDEQPVPLLTQAAIHKAIAEFTGEISQTPPRFSALKQHGHPLYELARKGQAVDPRPRRVTIRSLELIEWASPRLRIRALVSAGTYIRALARDLGRALGTVACLETLVRTQSGRFGLDRAAALDALDSAGLAARLIPIPEALADLPQIEVDAASALRLAQGRPLPSQLDGLGLARTSDGAFLALVRGKRAAMRTERVIHVR